MPRPKRHRKMYVPPSMKGFRPFGIPARQIKTAVLLYEEYEAIKLADYQGYTHLEAARKMNVSRPTFTRIYNRARQTIAKAFVEGLAIFIEGGNVQFQSHWYKCKQCFEVFSVPEPQKKPECPSCHSAEIENINENFATPNAGQMSLGAGGFCICPQCGTKTPHKRNVPCLKTLCPECQTPMIRENSYLHDFLKQNK